MMLLGTSIIDNLQRKTINDMSVSGKAVRDSPTLPTDSWAIATFLRVKPTFPPQTRVVDYHLQNIKISDGGTRSIIDLVIPPDADPGLVHNNSATGKLRYEFDHVFDPTSSQEEVFNMIAKEKIMGVLEGYSCTIFAYGQTGSGKTHTIFGGDSFAERGLIPRALGCLFGELKVKKVRVPSLAFKCQISFTEIYKETVYDLLEPNRAAGNREEWVPVQLLEGTNGLVLRNLNVYDVQTEGEALQLFFMGNNNRLTTATAMNSVSSRSHAVFTILLECEGIKADQTVFTSSKVNLVDLAGSERMYKMSNTKGMIKEAKAINLSLHFLEQVIISLRDQTLQIKQQQQQQLAAAATNAATAAPNTPNGAKLVTRNSFIPYRNSVLTNMLRDSLGGNCRSCFIMTITPEVVHFEETVATCRFGQRCGEVKVEITANSEVGLSDQLKVLTVKVRGLEKQLASIEDEKRRIAIELNKEHELRVRQTLARSLTPQEQLGCKTCVQELLAAAKESIALTAAGVGTPHEEDNALQAEEIIEASHDKLYDTVESMDKSVLVELSTALGGLVQSMFIDRETTKQRMLAEERQRRQAADEATARANLDKRATEQILAGNFNQLESSAILPEVLKSMVLKGAIFIKYNRLGMKDVRNMVVSEDLLHLTWRPLVNVKSKPDKDQGSHPLQFFESVDQDTTQPTRINLRGKPGQKAVVLEYADGNTDVENARGAQQWAAALRFLIRHANNS